MIWYLKIKDLFDVKADVGTSLVASKLVLI
jgi:hypothetical protein